MDRPNSALGAVLENSKSKSISEHKIPLDYSMPMDDGYITSENVDPVEAPYSHKKIAKTIDWLINNKDDLDEILGKYRASKPNNSESETEETGKTYYNLLIQLKYLDRFKPIMHGGKRKVIVVACPDWDTSYKLSEFVNTIRDQLIHRNYDNNTTDYNKDVIDTYYNLKFIINPKTNFPIFYECDLLYEFIEETGNSTDKPTYDDKHDYLIITYEGYMEQVYSEILYLKVFFNSLGFFKRKKYKNEIELVERMYKQFLKHFGYRHKHVK